MPDHQVSASLEIKRIAEGVLPEGFGPLRRVLEQTATERGCSRSSLTVLSAQRDPYRLDTPARHRDGKWFAQQVERFINHFDIVHLRGLHYRISASADVLKPNGRPYVNTDEDWEWLTENAAKSGRWLGYVDFSRIVDERNAPAEIYVPDAAYRRDFLSCGSRVELPLSLKEALPKFHLSDFRARQVYRISTRSAKRLLCAISYYRLQRELAASCYCRPARQAIPFWPRWRKEQLPMTGRRRYSISAISTRRVGKWQSAYRVSCRRYGTCCITI